MKKLLFLLCIAILFSNCTTNKPCYQQQKYYLSKTVI